MKNDNNFIIVLIITGIIGVILFCVGAFHTNKNEEEVKKYNRIETIGYILILATIILISIVKAM
jgi:hypothetical protein